MSTRMSRRGICAGLAATAVLVQGGRALAAGVAAVKALKAGEFIWRPEVSRAVR